MRLTVMDGLPEQRNKHSTTEGSVFSFERGQLLVLVRRITKHDAAKLQAFASFGQRVDDRAFLQRHTVTGLQYLGTRRRRILPVRIRRQATTISGMCCGRFRHQKRSRDRRFVQLTIIQVLVVLQMEILLAVRLLSPQLIALTERSKECRILWLLGKS